MGDRRRRRLGRRRPGWPETVLRLAGDEELQDAYSRTALEVSHLRPVQGVPGRASQAGRVAVARQRKEYPRRDAVTHRPLSRILQRTQIARARSEEHTSELQSLRH